VFPAWFFPRQHGAFTRGFARELSVRRRVLYNWWDRFGETDPPAPRARELILRK
jgi:hypothetical protein